MAEQKSAQVNVRLTPSLKEAAERAAETEKRSLSAFIEHALKTHLQLADATSHPGAEAAWRTIIDEWEKLEDLAREDREEVVAVLSVPPNGKRIYVDHIELKGEMILMSGEDDAGASVHWLVHYSQTNLLWALAPMREETKEALGLKPIRLPMPSTLPKKRHKI